MLFFIISTTFHHLLWCNSNRELNMLGCYYRVYNKKDIHFILRSWREGIKLVNTERIKIENKDYHTDFTIVNAVRRDTGKYTLRAENCNGFDQETVELTVLSKPSSPKGKGFKQILE